MSVLRLKTLAITATAVAAPLSATLKEGAQIIIQNIDAANEVYIGDSTVTSATGIRIAKDASLSLDSLIAGVGARRLLNLQNIYAICEGAESAALRVGYLSELDS